MSAPVSGATPERDPQRVAGARLWELLHPDQPVEWVRNDYRATPEQPFVRNVYGVREVLPSIPLDGNAMLSVIDAMRERGYRMASNSPEYSARSVWEVEFWEGTRFWLGHSKDYPAAVVDAAIQALGQA